MKEVPSARTLKVASQPIPTEMVFGCEMISKGAGDSTTLLSMIVGTSSAQRPGPNIIGLLGPLSLQYPDLTRLVSAQAWAVAGWPLVHTKSLRRSKTSTEAVEGSGR